MKPAGSHADLPDDRCSRIAHALVLAVGERLRRCNRHRVARMYAHRIEILDRADDDDVVLEITHHLQLELLPSDDRLFNQDGVHRAQVETALDDAFEFLSVKRKAAAGTAQRKRGTNDTGETDTLNHALRFADVSDDLAARRRKTDLGHGLFEKQPVFG